MGIDLFAYPATRKAKLHRDFLRLADGQLHAPARSVLHELEKRFVDPDGNFVEQFQTNGFDARTFELFLFAMFEDTGHIIDRSYDRPDFLLTKGDQTVAVEAVTSNRPGGKAVPYSPMGPDRTKHDYLHHLQNELAVRVGSPLFSKLQMQYWELPQVAQRPLIFALECFHEDGALSHSSAPIQEYLYGTRHTWYRDEEGRLIIVPQTIHTHQGERKPIPSGFFNQPGAEHVSAVLFCNTGTIAKFNRMGHQNRATKSRFVRMFRAGSAYRADPNASLPLPFLYEVGDPEWIETWHEGTVLVHNPQAIRPVPKGWLGAATETNLDASGQVITTFYDNGFTPYWSQTLLFPYTITRKQLDRALGNVMDSLERSLEEIPQEKR